MTSQNFIQKNIEYISVLNEMVKEKKQIKTEVSMANQPVGNQFGRGINCSITRNGGVNASNNFAKEGGINEQS